MCRVLRKLAFVKMERLNEQIQTRPFQVSVSNLSQRGILLDRCDVVTLYQKTPLNKVLPLTIGGLLCLLAFDVFLLAFDVFLLLSA